MRYIFCNHDPELSRAFLTELARRVPLENVDVIEGPTFTPPLGVPCTHLSRQSLYFEGYDVDWDNVEPVDQEILDRLATAEILAMPMFDRFEKYGNKLRRMTALENAGKFSVLDYKPYIPYAERKRQFARHVRFWIHHLKKTRPAALIHLNGSPHLIAEYVMFEVCKLLHVPTLFLTTLPITPKVLLTRDLGDYVGDLAGRTAAYLAALRRTGKPPDLDPVTQLYIDRQTGSDSEARPGGFTMKSIFHGRGYLRFSRRLWAKVVAKDVIYSMIGRQSAGAALLRYLLYWQLLATDRRLERRYRKYAVAPDLTRNFIYFPLHYQPEESTSPLGGAYETQVLIAEMLAYCVPPDWQVVVKEHPAQNSYGRDASLYDELAQMKNVAIVPTETNSYDLLRSCRAVATVSGTSGWEALCRGKPVLVFGHVPYQHAHGAFHVRTTADCQAAIERIVRGDLGITIDTMKCFLRAIQDCALDFRFSTSPVNLVSEFAEIPPDENVRNIVDAVLEALGEAEAHAAKRAPAR